MGIEISDRFIDGDLAACRRVVAEVLQIIRRSSTGKIRHKSNPKRTIYAELIRLKLGRRVIVDEVAWDIMNALRHQAFIRRIRDRRDENHDKSARIKVNEIDKFLSNLLAHHDDVFSQLLEEGNEVIQEIMNRYLGTVLFPMVEVTRSLRSARDEFNREVEADGSHTNVRKVPLNRVTAQLCNTLISITGKPHYGLGGQIVFSVGLEEYEHATYRQRSKAMQRRFKVWNERNALK